MAPENPLTQDFRRILLIKLSAVGDVFHTLPVLNQLRRRYPAAAIDWLTKPAMAELLSHHPAINRVITIPDAEWRAPWRDPLGAIRAMAQLVRNLRAPRYDLVLDLQGQFRSAACAMLTGASVRIGFDRPRAAVRAASRNLPQTAYRHGWAGARELSWLAYTHPIRLESLDLHAVDRSLRAGRLLGFDDAPPDFSFPVPQAAVARADALLDSASIAAASARTGLVLIAPGTVWETKKWTTDGFAAVASHFLRKGHAVALIGAGNDAAACAAVAAAAPGVVDLCGQTSLADLAALIRRAALVVTNDSGPMHLAVALGRPTVSIFGPTDALWVGPYGHPEGVVSAGLSCAPCYLRQLSRCPHSHACMTGLPATEVIARAESILADAQELPGRTLADLALG